MFLLQGLESVKTFQQFTVAAETNKNSKKKLRKCMKMYENLFGMNISVMASVNGNIWEICFSLKFT